MKQQDQSTNSSENAPYDALDRILTKTLRVMPWVCVGMAFTVLLIQVGIRFSTN